MKRKNLRKTLKISGCIAGCLLAVTAVYLLYVILDYHRIEDYVNLEIKQPSLENTAKTIQTGKQYTIITYNIGFGAYTPDFSFFMDGGTESVAKSKESVLETVTGAAKLVREENAQFYLFQEVDMDSTRSYHVDQYGLLDTFFPEYYSNIAVNYDSPYLFYPLLQPHGKSYAGLALYSQFPVTQAVRRSFPISKSFSKYLDLDRCYSVNRIPVENGRELCVYQLHMSAYGNNDAVRQGQISMICADMEAEYKAGNYIICGGDFNHDLKCLEDTGNGYASWAYPFPRKSLPDGLTFVLDSFSREEKNAMHNSARNADMAYEEGVTYTVTLDGFIISGNIACVSYENMDTGYAYSDHDPVKMVFLLKDQPEKESGNRDMGIS